MPTRRSFHLRRHGRHAASRRAGVGRAMCFSLEADLIAGAVVGTIAIDAMSHVRDPRERAIAVLPLVLAGHQFTEAVVWAGLLGHLQEPIWRGATWLYLAVAFAVLPGLVPFLAAAAEPTPRRRWMYCCGAVGLVVAGILVEAMVRGPIEASIDGHRIAYDVPLRHGGLVVGVYVAVVAGALLASSHREIRWFGAANLVAASGIAWIDSKGFISLWCFWAALTSVAIAVYLRRPRPGPSPAASETRLGRSVVRDGERP